MIWLFLVALQLLAQKYAKHFAQKQLKKAIYTQYHAAIAHFVQDSALGSISF